MLWIFFTLNSLKIFCDYWEGIMKLLHDTEHTIKKALEASLSMDIFLCETLTDWKKIGFFIWGQICKPNF